MPINKRLYTFWALALASVGLLSFFLLSYAYRGPSASDINKRFLMILRSDDRKNAGSTLASLDEILTLDPDHADALLLRASKTEDPVAAIGFLERVKNGDAEKIAKARFFMGDLYLNQRDSRRAEAAFRGALLAFPGQTDAQHRLVSLFALLRRPEDVRDQLTAIREVRPLTLEELALWVTCENRFTSFEEARSLLEGFVATHPDDMNSLRAHSIYLDEESKSPEAIQQLQSAANIKNPGLAFLLARLLLREKRANEAIKVLASVDPADARSGDDWETLAIAASTVGDVGLARTTTEFAAAKFPFHRSLAYLHYRSLTEPGDAEQQAIWKARVEALNALYAAVETVGVTIVRGRPDPRPVARVAELLLVLEMPSEAAAWVEQAVQIAGPDQITLKLQNACQRMLAGSSKKKLKAPVKAWKDRGPLEAPNEALSAPANTSHLPTSIRLADRANEYGLKMQFENGHSGMKYLLEAMGAGTGVIDLDNDGWPDLYFPQGGRLGDGPEIPLQSDQVFRNHFGIRLDDVTGSVGILDFRYSLGLAVGDVNEDGFDDVVVANLGRNSLFLNCGDGTFLDETHASGLDDVESMSTSMALADLDGDADLDLYVVNYVDGLKVCRDDQQQIATCNPSSHDGTQDHLYENLGDGRFRNITKSTLIDEGRGKGLGVIIAQFDDDQRPDIFVSNDTTPNLLFSNRCEQPVFCFEENGMQSGVAVSADGTILAGMGIACGDLNHDQRTDLYVTNFFREQNTLYLQTSAGMFQDLTSPAELREPTLALLGFGAQAVDLDLDGWLELFVVNGHIDDQSQKGVPWKMAPQLFRTSDGQGWEEISRQCGDFMLQKCLGRGVSVLDVNRDHKPDFAVGYQDRPAGLVVNESMSIGRALTLRLIGTQSNRSAINAVVRWSAAGQPLMTEIRGGDGYLCSNERRLTLGLGESSLADFIEVQWPDGSIQRFEQVAAGSDYMVRQGSSVLMKDVR